MKRRLNKLFAAFLAVMLLVSCLSLTALAADPEEKEDTPAADTSTVKHVYELYQIFTGNYDETSNVLGDIKWGLNGNVAKDGETTKVGDAVSDTVLADLKSVSQSSSDSAKLAVVEKYVVLTGTPYKGENDQPEKQEKGNGLVYENVTPGYYLIKDKENSQTGTGTNYTLYVVKATDGEILFEPKGSVPTVEKEVKNGDSWGDTNSASIGADVDYRITGSISSRIADYATYYYKFTDTLSKGLTYKKVYTKDANGEYYLLKDGTYTKTAPVTGGGENDTSANYASITDKYTAKDDNLKVYLVNGTDEKDVTKYFYVGVSDYSKDNGTTITVAIKDLKALLLIGKDVTTTEKVLDDKGNDTGKTQEVTTFVSDYTITGTTQIVVKYTAVLNENAVVAPAHNDNTVKLVYSNNPNNSGTPTTTPPSDTPPTEEPKTDLPTGETVEDKTETYTTSLIITKMNENNKILTGAEFTLTGSGVKKVLVTELDFVKADDGTYYLLKDGTYTATVPVTDGSEGDNSSAYQDTTTKYKKTTKITLKDGTTEETNVKGEVDANGIVKFTGLGAGDYTLTESVTPTGYNTMTPISFTISYKDGAFKSDRDDIVYDATDGEFDMTVINKPGSTLPRTGGIGTTIFYVVGTILVLSAGILLITKKRMGREQN
jgi:LPXTG-motif cell wall-anchored protein